jgi:hypothetical protein
MTATEAFRCRRPVEFNMPDTIMVSIGYLETIEDSPWSTQRSFDFQLPVCDTCTPPAYPGVPSKADNFIGFIDTTFPNADFDRDALYGHSFGDLFVLYALTVRPGLFDTFLAASIALTFNSDYVFNHTDFMAPLTSPNTTLESAFV